MGRIRIIGVPWLGTQAPSEKARELSARGTKRVSCVEEVVLVNTLLPFGRADLVSPSSLAPFLPNSP